ncbi:HrcA family transcriptional regulator [Synechococcus sp. CS-1324]|uniref:HrcA family transcriptional regulator n=1 Tax=unclassified Synechococcus TaxID=2626047 RepID=UPI000DB075DD|nr:HrcA family transcriptional regulator [Synechococcus sp. CS-1326]MCT0229708.1 HrcA family transcriptional regulator [Synechococcus sp. CS-1324]MCT0232373.1 HrcA family transcriptional regulator [Synechococcus sp. CS-1327]PZV04321.1 MAG: HrcA family transcriptional regulator [Cyanobium sp.]
MASYAAKVLPKCSQAIAKKPFQPVLPELTRRDQQVLRATVQHYVDTVEPVGSQTLVKRFGFPASPATVRTAMGVLEQRGLLVQPHPSAGRVPSQQGYRLFVDDLLPAPGAGALQLEKELLALSLQWAALDDLLLHLARRLADLTGLLSLITRPQRPQSTLQAVRLVPSQGRLLIFLVEAAGAASSLNVRLPPGAEVELTTLECWVVQQLESSLNGTIHWQELPSQLECSGRVVRQALSSHRLARSAANPEGAVALGLSGLLAQPEFSQTAMLRPLVKLVEEEPQRLLRRKGPESAWASDPPDANDAANPGDGVWIGAEHPHPALRACSVVQASYRTGDGSRGQVALVGPMRMAYATARAAVRTVATSLQRLLS